MFSFRTTSLLEQPDTVLRGGKIALLCNHAAWHPEMGEYLFETLFQKGLLKKVFVPEHGLFGEINEQTESVDTIYSDLKMSDCEFISISGNKEEDFSAYIDKLADIDALIVELQDTGSRYHTFYTIIINLFTSLKKHSANLPVYIIDRANPAGRQVEGSALHHEYESFAAIESIVHRHGLTIGEVAYLFYNEINAKFPLHIIAYNAECVSKQMLPWSIPPFPNIPGLFTCHFYSGQCLWEGTNMSEGKGTTRPYELFGAPYVDKLSDFNRKNGFKNWNDPKHPLYNPAVFIRYCRFVPISNKYCGEICFGFQLHPVPGIQYHALAHNLKIMEFIRRNCEGFSFRKREDDIGNDRRTIDALLGDKMLIEYICGQIKWEEAMEHIKIEEQKWIRKAKRFVLYEEQLYRCK